MKNNLIATKIHYSTLCCVVICYRDKKPSLFLLMLMVEVMGIFFFFETSTKVSFIMDEHWILIKFSVDGAICSTDAMLKSLILSLVSYVCIIPYAQQLWIRQLIIIRYDYWDTAAHKAYTIVKSRMCEPKSKARVSVQKALRKLKNIFYTINTKIINSKLSYSVVAKQ